MKTFYKYIVSAILFFLGYILLEVLYSSKIDWMMGTYLTILYIIFKLLISRKKEDKS